MNVKSKFTDFFKNGGLNQITAIEQKAFNEARDAFISARENFKVVKAFCNSILALHPIKYSAFQVLRELHTYRFEAELTKMLNYAQATLPELAQIYSKAKADYNRTVASIVAAHCSPSKQAIPVKSITAADGEKIAVIAEGDFVVDYQSTRELFVTLHKVLKQMDSSKNKKAVIHFKSAI